MDACMQQLPSVGDRVAAGQLLGRLEPRLSSGGDDRRLLNPPWRKHRRQSMARRRTWPARSGCWSERAVPGRRVEDARRAVAVADARVTAARARLAQREEVLASGGGTASGNAFILRAPIAGRVAEVFAALGASCTEGTPLFRIVRSSRVELQARARRSRSARTHPDGDRVRNSGTGRCHRAEADHVHDAGVIDPRTRALPLQIEVENRNGQLLVGQIGTQPSCIRDGRNESPSCRRRLC